MFKKLKRYWYNLTHPKICDVWELHRVTPENLFDEGWRPYVISPNYLEYKINDALQKGFRFVSVEELYAMLNGECYRLLPQKNIVITFDDGYLDNFEYAYPILKKYNIPFCIFVAADFMLTGVQKSSNGDIAMMDANVLSLLAKDELCTIGGHTISHLKLAKLPDDQQKYEICESLRMLEKTLNKPIEYFAYPYGSYDNVTLSIIDQINIKMSFAAWGGSARKDCNLLCVPRVIISSQK